ncbi:MAG: DUF167 domain-containing protein [Woeseiaceae bacterium]
MIPDLAACSRRDGDDLILNVRVHPRASRSSITGVANGALQVRTTAAPTDGKANKAVTRMLGKFFGVAPSAIRLLRGQTNRDKQFLVTNGANRL